MAAGHSRRPRSSGRRQQRAALERTPIAQSLKNRIGEFPQNPRDQNSCWYQLFQKYQTNVIVSDSHKRFLLFRDSSSLTLLILVIAWIAFALSGAPSALQAVVVGGLAVQFIWLAISARNTGIRLVQNVLALESRDDGGKKK